MKKLVEILASFQICFIGTVKYISLCVNTIKQKVLFLRNDLRRFLDAHHYVVKKIPAEFFGLYASVYK